MASAWPHTGIQVVVLFFCAEVAVLTYSYVLACTRTRHPRSRTRMCSSRHPPDVRTLPSPRPPLMRACTRCHAHLYTLPPSTHTPHRAQAPDAPARPRSRAQARRRPMGALPPPPRAQGARTPAPSPAGARIVPRRAGVEG